MLDSTYNKTIKEIKKLLQKKYINLYQMTLVYNNKVIQEAIATNQIICLITNKIDPNIKVKQLLVSERILCYLHPHNHCDQLAIVSIKMTNNINTKQVLVLDDIKDPGNLGSLLRSAYSFGIKQVVLSKECCDIRSYKTIIASAGSIFHLEFMICDLQTYLTTSSLPLITTYLDESGANSFSQEFNLLLGNEQLGINQEYKNLKHDNFKIKTDFESLNVSVAGGIVIYELTK